MNTLDLKQICIHFMSGNCKYGPTCTKIHVTPTTELLNEIDKKGPTICNFYPNCKFTNSECKKIHIDIENQCEKEINDFRKLYLKLIYYDTNDEIKLDQIERIKFMVKSDFEIIKDTFQCISEK